MSKTHDNFDITPSIISEISEYELTSDKKIAELENTVSELTKELIQVENVRDTLLTQTKTYAQKLSYIEQLLDKALDYQPRVKYYEQNEEKINTETLVREINKVKEYIYEPYGMTVKTKKRLRELNI